MTCPGAPGLEVGPAVGDPNCLLRCRMTMWTPWCSYFCPHFCKYRSPDWYHHPATLMKSGISVICNMMHEGRLLQGKHLMGNEEWLLS